MDKLQRFIATENHMRKLVLAAIIATVPFGTAYAQMNAPTAPSTDMTATEGLKSGANSFTETQAKDRIEKAGFSSVGGLTKTSEGMWTGKAIRNGKEVMVTLDFKGNISHQ